MPRISQPKKDKISEQIIHYLFSISPKPKFTAEIAREIARDEEFTKSLLLNLKKSGFIAEVDKNHHGRTYTKRQRWLLSGRAFLAYKDRASSIA